MKAQTYTDVYLCRMHVQCAIPIINCFYFTFSLSLDFVPDFQPFITCNVRRCSSFVTKSIRKPAIKPLTICMNVTAACVQNTQTVS